MISANTQYDSMLLTERPTRYSTQFFVRRKITWWIFRTLLPLLFMFIFFSSAAEAAFNECSTNRFTSNDLIGMDATVSCEGLFVYAYTRDAFGGIVMPGTTKKFEFFIDIDHNIDTGDVRPGAIRGMDYRVSCNVLIDELATCYLYALPSVQWEAAQNVGQIPAIIYKNVLRINIPNLFNPVDIIAFAHGATDFYGEKTGNGDRCPEEGIFDTATGTNIIRQSAVVVDEIITDFSGPDLQSWRFQTHGDQFRIQIDYKYILDPLSLTFSGRLEMDTDQNLDTGLLHSPFVLSKSFNDIPSWGWDVAIEYMGGGGTASDPTPFSLDFGTQSKYIIPPSPTYASPYYFPFGEGYNDGRWLIIGNKVVLEGSLSMLDARRWQIIPNLGLNVDRVTANGRTIGRLFTRDSYGVRDMIPKNDQAFDTETGATAQAISWQPDKLVTGQSPYISTSSAADMNDFMQVDAQIDGNNLIVCGTLVRLEPGWNWGATKYIVFLDTDGSSGTPVNNDQYNTEVIYADHQIMIDPVDLYAYIGYTMNILKPDGTEEGRDSGLNIRFSDPYVLDSPARLVVTIPLSAIGNPQGEIKLYMGSFDIEHNLLIDVAPMTPLSLNTTEELPNLIPYRPNDWSDKIVISNITGTNTDTTILTELDALYLDWAVLNNSTVPILTKFDYALYVDGEQLFGWHSNSLNSGHYTNVTDFSLGMLSTGIHEITIVADSTDVISESNEIDNTYTKTITIDTVDLQPSVVGTTPDDKATGVNVLSTITATFSEAMDPTSINTTTFSLSNEPPGVVTYDPATFTATFEPSKKLLANTTYTANITTAAKDVGGNPMAAIETWTFTTVAVVGDTDNDNDVDGIDLSTCAQEYNDDNDCSTFNHCNCDLDENGVVDDIDLHLFCENFGIQR